MTNHEKTLRALDQPQLRAGEADLRVDDRGGSMLRACACSEPDPVMQADRKFYCHRCSFQTGARPVGLEPERWMMPAGTLTQEMALNNGSTTPLLPDIAGTEPRLDLQLRAMCYRFHNRSPMAVCRDAVDEGGREHCIICRAADALVESQKSNWQSIETAPKDGTVIVTWNGKARALAAYDAGLGVWVHQAIYKEPSREVGILSDTHWMPLPAPPSEET